ncbi:MAG TPA: DUF4097 family beta strand repeat-containing protein [Pyrinomonadaceae bacterium]|jgi:DUF4097 and DUF4098 domain-containing protein YvlB|nr:DUF4097 family beta strand repeat-containing protein [Pyrinomonadaceae bacterium]
MRRQTRTRLLPALLLTLLAAATASAQDFRRSYNLAPGSAIEIRNASGDINIRGHEGSAVEVAVYKEGRDRDKVQVEDLSTADRVSLRSKYDENCNCDASLRFEVRVPRSARFNFDKITSASGSLHAENITGRLNFNTASGNVELERVSGEIEAASASGNVIVKGAAGVVRASTASGDVNVEITRLEGGGDMRFSTASGNVNVRMPQGLDARVHLATMSGSIETNFPIQVEQSEHGPGARARGQLGAGSRELRATSASGNVSLKSL